MIFTVIKGKVPRENWEAIKENYLELDSQKPNGLKDSYLIQNKDDQDIWELVAFWQDMESIKRMQDSGTPPGITLFSSMGVQPNMDMWEIVDRN